MCGGRSKKPGRGRAPDGKVNKTMNLQANPKHRVVLIGFRGSGKTTLGKQLAKKLQWRFISTDELIERKRRMKIPELVIREGWNSFRNIERQVIAGLRSMERTVIDCGGGVVEDPAIMEVLLPGSLVVWVDADLPDIHQRLQQGEKPPLLNQNNLKSDIDFNYRRRQPLYDQYADIRLNSSRLSLEKMAIRIAKMMFA